MQALRRCSGLARHVRQATLEPATLATRPQVRCCCYSASSGASQHSPHALKLSACTHTQLWCPPQAEQTRRARSTAEAHAGPAEGDAGDMEIKGTSLRGKPLYFDTQVRVHTEVAPRSCHSSSPGADVFAAPRRRRRWTRVCWTP